MNKEFKFNGQDKEHHEKNIRILVDDIIPIIIDYYKSYDVAVTGVVYDSAEMRFGRQNTSISFETQAGNKIYPIVTIDISHVGRGFKAPSQREFNCTFHIRGLDKDLVNKLYRDFNIINHFMIAIEDGDASSKVQEAIAKSQEPITTYIDMVEASKLFFM